MLLNSQINSSHEIIIPLVICGGLFLFCFGFFSIVFFIHRWMLQVEYQIKENYNRVVQFLALNKFKYLELLAKSNNQLQLLVQKIIDSKNIFEKQLELVRKKIISLSCLNRQYLYWSSYKLSKQIRSDLKKCSNMVSDLRNTSSSATRYSKNISDLLVEYRGITNRINHFYEFHLAFRYPNETFTNMRAIIQDTITKSAEYVIKFDNEKLLKLLHDLNERITVFYQIVLRLYTFDRMLMYLQSLKRKIEESLKDAEKMLSSTDYMAIEKSFAIGKINFKLMEDHLKNVSFNNAKNNSIIAIKHLEDVLLKIQMGDKTNVLIQKNIKILKDQITILNKDWNQISSALSNINKHFDKVKDVSVLNKIVKLTADIKYIVIYYQNLESEYASYKNIQRNDFLLKIRELSLKIILWKNDLNALINEVNNKYKDAIMINDELADIKLTLCQLLGIKMQVINHDQKEIDAIQNIINYVNNLQQQLDTNYFESYANVKLELAKISEQTALLISSTTYTNILKIYAKRLIFYGNKYRNEHQEIEKRIEAAELQYQNGNYKKTIDEMIEMVSSIVRYARESKISLN